MSARYHNIEHTHPYSWEQVARGIFQRYPNPFASHVLCEDTFFREVRNGVLYSKRFLMKTNKVPKWGERWLGGFSRRVPLVEESVVDSTNKTITTYTRNVGMHTFMTVAERVVYRVDPDNPDQTIAVKEAWVESGFYGLRSAIKNFGIERFKANCVRATDGFNFVLARLQTQQTSLREMGSVRLAELNVRRDQIKSQAENLKLAVKERRDLLKERSTAFTSSAKETYSKAADLAKAHSTVNASEQDSCHK